MKVEAVDRGVWQEAWGEGWGRGRGRLLVLGR